MEITLEQIELVKDRTGVSYKEAKEALEASNGDVINAIIYIEDNINNQYENNKDNVECLLNTVKNIIRSGNVSRIRVFSGDDLILNIPVTVGTVAALLFPWGILAATVASAASKCKVEIVKADGSIIDVNEKAENIAATVKNKGGVVVDEIKEKGADIYSATVDKGSEFFVNAKLKGSDVINEAKERGTAIYENTKDKFSEFIRDTKEDKVVENDGLDAEEESN